MRLKTTAAIVAAAADCVTRRLARARARAGAGASDWRVALYFGRARARTQAFVSAAAPPPPPPFTWVRTTTAAHSLRCQNARDHERRARARDVCLQQALAGSFFSLSHSFFFERRAVERANALARASLRLPQLVKRTLFRRHRRRRSHACKRRGAAESSRSSQRRCSFIFYARCSGVFFVLLLSSTFLMCSSLMSVFCCLQIAA